MRIAVFIIVYMLVNYYSNTLNALDIISWGTALIFQVIGVGFSLYGGYLWAKLKGRHWAWMFTMPLLVGLLVLPMLKDRKQGKSTWHITGIVVLAFLVLVTAVVIIGREKFMSITITSAIAVIPLAIIVGLASLIHNLIERRKIK